MAFNSIEFCLFVIVVWGLHELSPSGDGRGRKRLLVVASFAFYACWSPLFVPLLVAATIVDFTVGRTIAGSASPVVRRVLLLVSVVWNLGVLCFFKYGGFLAATWHGLAGGSHDPWMVDVILPIVISFYTFESLSYVVDVYRGEPAAEDLLDFALFLSFFPHLVAGPIVRPRMFLPQLRRPRVPSDGRVERAVARIAQGYLKKLVLADGLGVYVDYVWHDPTGLGVVNVMLAVYAYAFQIYLDFSGYTDIALGIAALFGYVLPENFDRPYLAESPREFWRRWHQSLSTWLRDYLYVPLGGNRFGTLAMYRNLLLTMTLGGLWHGAAWTFVLWGAFHGGLLIVERVLVPRVPSRGIGGAFARVVTFHLVCLGWVVFRAPSFAAARNLLEGMCRLAFEPSRAMAQAAVLVLIAALLHLGPEATRVRAWWIERPAWAQGMAYAALVWICLLLSPSGQRFIYFQF